MKQQQFTVNDKNLVVEVSDSFLSRFRGLMLRQELDEGQGLLITPCSSVHMMFMRFAIDVVYLDKDYMIKKIVHNLWPWIGLSMCLGADSVLELKSGEAQRLNLQVGQKFSVSFGEQNDF